MFIDCNASIPDEKICADVCIIGSGPAGLALARTLIEQGKMVVFVERGGKFAAKPLSRNVLYKSDSYDGIHNGIAFGYGGTGALWGGQLLPMLDSELLELGHPWSSEEFMKTLRVHSQVIEEWVGVSITNYEKSLLELIKHPAESLKWGGFFPLFSKWIPFRRRNLGSAWLKLFQQSNKVRVLLNLQPNFWEFFEDSEKTIKSVTCHNTNGNFVRIEADCFVVAGGALESPLILEKMLGSTVSEKLGVGKYLHDHLSLRIAEISDYSLNEFERLFAPFFTGSTMRSLRLCLPDQNNGLANPPNWSYCHFVIEAPENSGFAVVRDILRGLQAKNYLGVMKAFYKLPLAIGGILRMLWMRYFKNRLAISKGSRIYINVDFVKTPLVDNSIQFNKNGNPDEIVLDWTITENLQDQVNSAYRTFHTFWNENQLQKIGKLKKIECDGSREKAIENIYDIYHPAGTCAIGRVVDSNLRIYGVTNGFVVGSSVFSQLGRSNPTLTIMALSRHLGFTIASLLNPASKLQAHV